MVERIKKAAMIALKALFVYVGTKVLGHCLCKGHEKG